ncbi:putative L-lysine 2,3-aminomutase aq_1632 isoform X2 [Branchiostoma lanceolatum]|uniref:putative L-lysine 2,3-aminomutase aq_1632 isoform X1 n=1 Tax=Branchiostoma lanceolatum TaxID=7740 RepID=UPI00345674EB
MLRSPLSTSLLRVRPRSVRRLKSTLTSVSEKREDDFEPTVYPTMRNHNRLRLYTRSLIPSVLNTYLPESSKDLDPVPYVAAATVLPMRTNNYVVQELIDWSNVPEDPIFQLTFPQPDMLKPEALERISKLLEKNAPRTALQREAERIRKEMNPHPAQQKTLNVPRVDGHPLPGLQHKYRETVLFFPAEGQFCHAYCTYCFRWAQFTSVGSPQQFQSDDSKLLQLYLRRNRHVSDLLLTGGDPMVMSAQRLGGYILPLLKDPCLDHLSTIRIGTKSLAYWPYRYVSDTDSDDLLRIFEEVVKSGRQLAIMAHFTHPRELSTPTVQEAIRRLRMAGVVIRAQAPLINHVNADPATWARLVRTETRLGVIPYYMFVERDTGARHYFEVPLARAVEIYSKAFSSVSGLGRTLRGPSMSATPGKVHVVGVSEIAGEKVFVLKMLQGRNPEWTHQIFHAQYDEKATWLDQLKPAFGQEKFFFEDELKSLEREDNSSGNLYPYSPGMEYRCEDIFSPGD